MKEKERKGKERKGKERKGEKRKEEALQELEQEMIARRKRERTPYLILDDDFFTEPLRTKEGA